MNGLAQIVADQSYRWLRDAWEAEYPFPRPHYTGRGLLGSDKEWLDRLLGDRFILWVASAEPGLRVILRGGRIVALDENGQEHWNAAEWLLPAHEALKRLRGRNRKYLPWLWLRAVLAWRGLPCPCNHRDIVSHLAAAYGRDESEVAGRVVRAAREAHRLVLDLAPA